MISDSRAPILARDVSLHYPDRARPALEGVTESISLGEAVVVTGPSGCGKSTLCRAICGFIPELIPARVGGELRVEGLSVWETDAARLGTHVGLVQQDADAQICTLGVEDEVSFGPENLRLPRKEIQERVHRVMNAVGIESLRGRRTTTLSGGEKQRLAIASILAMEPKILLLDEPTAHLDPAGASQLFGLLRDLRQRLGLTLLVIEHRLGPLSALSPRVVVLDEGRIVTRRPDRSHHERLGESIKLKGERSTSAEPRARVGELSFAYEAPLLQGITFDVCAGEVLGVIGPNGGGKTTLLRLLAGLEDPLSGRIEVDAEVGFVFQHPHHQIFERTVDRELAIGGAPGCKSSETWLSEGRLEGLGDAPPLSLSLGEQRRLTLITALWRRPGILLLDEPFIGQDRRNVEWIVTQIRDQSRQGVGIVLVSHDIDLLSILADRVLYLDPAIEQPIYGAPDHVFHRLRSTGRDAFVPGFWEAVS